MTTLDPRDGLRGGPRLMADVNVTPFIDIMLVLLIVFMVTAPLLTAGASLDLPKASASPLSGEKTALVVSLDREGRLFLGEEPVEEATLADRLRAALALRPERAVHMRCDKTVPYGRIMALLEQVGEGGVSSLSLVAETAGPDRADGGRP